ncbi:MULTISPECIES: YaaR family protein [Clostridium]|uniref:YaaR family protein n=1 Tax=Clostridium TaxID=1485 RepID=UPI0004096E97|nr:YaaR family protein [Clostridium cadaveris]MDU4950808.1 YaaR family protein [Clostridium sp.]NME63722.1 YaaR family protein [Clostridium cadaveris]NWK12576.1 YaaR family protein [Clostridium cadaveris]
MKIQGVNSNRMVGMKDNRIQTKNDFSDNLMKSYQSATKEELENYIKEIKKKGSRLAATKSYVDVKNYKETIKKYLKTVVEYTYSLNKNLGFWENQYYSTVDTINEKLEELTKEILKEEKETLKISSAIDNIQGLLVDIYK